jgi:hypothetical protein
MSATIGYIPPAISVEYEELHDFVHEQGDQQGLRAQKKYKVAWADRLKFYGDVMGHVVTVGGIGGTVTRRIPLQYPDIPALYAVSFEMEPVGLSDDGTKPALGGKQIVYDWAWITVGFSTVPWNFQALDDPNSFTPGLYRTESLEMGGEVMQFPKSAYEFESTDRLSVQQTPGRIVPTASLGITLHDAPYIPFTDIFALIGAVNVGVFYGCAIGTVLFMGGQSEAQTNSVGQRVQKLSLKFSFRSLEWNLFLKPDGSGWDYLKLRGSGGGPGNRVYPYGDFTPILF